jgi:hypothetical protein
VNAMEESTACIIKWNPDSVASRNWKDALGPDHGVPRCPGMDEREVWKYWLFVTLAQTYARPRVIPIFTSSNTWVS